MFRFWDGRTWSEQTTSDPAAPPPGQAVPPAPAPPTQVTPGQYGAQDPYQQQQPYDPYQPQPQQYGGGGYGGQDPYGATGGSGGGGGKRAWLIALVVLVIVALGVGGFFGVSALTGDDGDDTATDDSSQSAGPDDDDSESPTDPTESPTDSPTEASPTDSPTDSGPTGAECSGGLPTTGGRTTGGRISGGDLSLSPVGGYTPMEAQLISVFTFADEVAAVQKDIVEGWIAMYAVGALPKANGYTDLEASADQVITCMTESENFYRNFSGRNDLDGAAVEINGYDAYSITTELRVDDPEVRIEGDVARVIVVDTGDDEHFGVYISVVPIGNENLIGQQEAATAQLHVDD
jgi:hypothetical protein